MECTITNHLITDNGYVCECGYFISKNYILQTVENAKDEPV